MTDAQILRNLSLLSTSAARQLVEDPLLLALQGARRLPGPWRERAARAIGTGADDDELRRELTVDAPVRRSFDEKAVELLRALGVADPEEKAPEFVALVDAVLMYRAVEAAPIDPVGVVETYLTGLLVRQKPTATR